MEKQTIQAHEPTEIVRFSDSKLLVDEPSEGEATPIFRGEAMLFKEAYTEIAPNYFERISPDFLRDADLSDVKVNFNHDSLVGLLGRTSSGTARIEIGADAVRFELDVPPTTLGKDLQVLVKRGDVKGCSFHAKLAKGGIKVQRNGEKIYVDLLKASKLEDLSIVTDPAYKEAGLDTVKRFAAAICPRGAEDKVEMNICGFLNIK